MVLKTLLALCVGASLGAALRWFLGITLNAVFVHVPLGTLVANLLGGFLVGFAVSAFDVISGFSDQWRLFVITGFLGALTTFSTFSVEVVTLLQSQRIFWAMGVVLLHVLGSISMTFCGIAAFHMIERIIAR